MGAAAYNRGTRALRAQIDAELPSLDARLFDDLLTEATKHDGVSPSGPTVIRFGPAVGEVSIMNRQDRGWAEYSYTYKSLWTLVRRWRVAIVGLGEDKHGRFLRCVPLETYRSLRGKS